MTPPDLVTLLDLVALALGRVADGSTTPISDLSEAAAGIAQVRAALLASPPEVPADLVALWSEYREAFQVDPEEQEDDGPRYQRLVKAHRALLDWTPPAASGPPAAPPETVKCWKCLGLGSFQRFYSDGGFDAGTCLECRGTGRIPAPPVVVPEAPAPPEKGQ